MSAATYIKKHAVIAAGGTGGHVYPALAFAAAWQAKGHQVSWMGTAQGLEASILPQYAIPLYFVAVKGLRGRGKYRKFLALWGAARAFFQALSLLKKLQPQVVLGMGGYVSGPGALAAKCLGIPVVIHEQNAIAGKTNQIVSRFAKRVLAAFPQVMTQQATKVCGNPVRVELLKLQPKKQVQACMNILILGGSRGALSLNKRLPAILASIADITVWHQTGPQHLAQTQEIYHKENFQAKVVSYIDDMVAAYDWADVVICRAGAMTVFEIMAVGRPAIFIPFPHAVDDHQTANANYLVAKEGGMLIQERDLTLEKLSTLLTSLRDEENYQRITRNAFLCRKLDADQAIVQACLEVAL